MTNAERIASLAYDKGMSDALTEVGLTTKVAVERFTQAVMDYADASPEMNYRPRWAVGSTPGAEAAPQQPIERVPFDQARPGQHIDLSTAPAEYRDGSPTATEAAQQEYLRSAQAQNDQMAYSRPQAQPPKQETIEAPSQEQQAEAVPQLDDAPKAQSAYDAETMNTLHSAYAQLIQAGYTPDVAKQYIGMLLQRMQGEQAPAPEAAAPREGQRA